jgi:hypothetical protein
LTPLLNGFRKVNSVLYGTLELYIWLWLRPQIVAVCVALQPLEVPALITLTIIDELFERSSLFTMALKWRSDHDNQTLSPILIRFAFLMSNKYKAMHKYHCKSFFHFKPIVRSNQGLFPSPEISANL